MTVTCVLFFIQLILQLEFCYKTAFFLLTNHIVILEIFCTIHSIQRVKKMKVRKMLSWTLLSDFCLFEKCLILFLLLLKF